MPLVNNKVGDAGTDSAVAEGKALVESLLKVSCSALNRSPFSSGRYYRCIFTSFSIFEDKLTKNNE